MPNINSQYVSILAGCQLKNVHNMFLSD